jgi:hypothetical protein
MSVRADSAFISGVLFTIALASLIPAALRNTSAGRDRIALATLDAGFRAEAQTSHYLGVACSAIILIGLIVVWTGYVNRARSAWLVMFVATWVWGFPLLVLPLFGGKISVTFSEWLYDAISEPGLARTYAESLLIFSLMVVALLLPIKRFFVAREVEEPIYRSSARLVGFSLIGVPVIVMALYAWIRVGVLYQIPASELSSYLRTAIAGRTNAILLWQLSRAGGF